MATQHFSRHKEINGFFVNVICWSGSVRPFRGVVFDGAGAIMAHTGGCKGPSSALDKAAQLARTL